MPKTESPRNPIPEKRKLPSYILAVYTLALIIANFYKPQWFLDLDWWIYLPLLPLVIWFIIAYKKDN
ncbi:MAG: hypothetical protein RBT34_03785 [Anaerolineaceae bacterium]|jgi:hypothetical protein|nr:hypothetical protein [Anaerolineaceae bacterium]